MIRATPNRLGLTATTEQRVPETSERDAQLARFADAIRNVAPYLGPTTIDVPRNTISMQFEALCHSLHANSNGPGLHPLQAETTLQFIAANQDILRAHPEGNKLIEAADLFAAFVIRRTGQQIQAGTLIQSALPGAVHFLQAIAAHPPSAQSANAAATLLARLLPVPPMQDRAQAAAAESKKRKASLGPGEVYGGALQAPSAKRHQPIVSRDGAPMNVAEGGKSIQSIIKQAADRARGRVSISDLLASAAFSTEPLTTTPAQATARIASSTQFNFMDVATADALLHGELTASRKSAPLAEDVRLFLGVPRSLRIRELIPWLQGQVFFITQSLKRGSFGKVRLAMGADGEIYAIKQIRTHQSAPKGHNSGSGKRITARTTDFEIEKEIAIAKIVDPDLAPLERILVNGDQCLVMPFVLGSGREVANRLPTDVRRYACRIMIEDMMTMLADRMHANNIMHGDMKPDNTLVVKETGTTHIADFGSATWLEDGELIASGNLTGTYMAPEKCQGVAYGMKSDIWEAGAGILSLVLGYAGQTIANPFSWRPDSTGKFVDFDAMCRVHARYDAWFISRLGEDGLLDVSKMTDPTDEFDPIFHRALRADPTTIQFTAGSLLRTDPDERADSSSAKLFFQSLNATHSEEARLGRESLMNLPYDLDVQRNMQALERVRDYRISQQPDLLDFAL